MTDKNRHNTRTLRYLSAVAGRSKLSILLLIFTQTAQGICGVCYALFLKEIINAAVAGQWQPFFTHVAGFAALVCLQLVIMAANRFFTEQTKATLENRMKSRLFTTLLRKDYARVSAVHSGEWMNRLTSDTSVVADGMVSILPSAVGMAVRMLGAVTMIIVLEYRFVYLIVPVGVVMILLSHLSRKTMKRMHKTIQERDGQLRIFMQEILESMLVVRSFGVEERISGEATGKMRAHKQARMKRTHFSNFCSSGFSVVMRGAYVVAAFCCGVGILRGVMSYGTFMAVLQLIGQVQMPFANISGVLPRYYAMLASAERLMEVETLPEREGNEAYSLQEIRQIYTEHFDSMGMEEARFAYLPYMQCDDTPMPITLHDVSFEVKKGEYVALVGPSGCGKSTLLKLLMCLYPLDGGKRYVCTDGVRQPLTEQWQRLFAYVPQGNHLMSGTIREIVAFSDKEKMFDQEAVGQALAVACADEFVSELDDGADTLLGERGSGLSEGQMQRLAIARAVFSGYPVLMLDECTSALDEATEQRLLQNLRRMTDKTVFLVAHRPAAWEICDKVIRFTAEGSIAGVERS